MDLPELRMLIQSASVIHDWRNHVRPASLTCGQSGSCRLTAKLEGNLEYAELIEQQPWTCPGCGVTWPLTTEPAAGPAEPVEGVDFEDWEDVDGSWNRRWLKKKNNQARAGQRRNQSSRV